MTTTIYPGATGFGIFHSAGRGGSVRVVNSTSGGEATIGSFEWALVDGRLEDEPRIIVFATGGLFVFDGSVTIPSFTSVLGQTAPADSSGVTFALPVATKGNVLDIKSNVLLRFVRVRRRWDALESLNRAGMSDRCCGHALSMNGADDVAIDHVSLSWGGGSLLRAINVHNLHLSNSMLASSFYNDEHEPHMGGYGAVIDYGANNVTVYRNVFFNGVNGWPSVDVSSSAELVNNLVHDVTNNMAVTAAQDDDDVSTEAHFNILGNRFVHHIDRNGVLLSRTPTGDRDTRVYVEDNLGCARPLGTEPEKDIVGYSTNSRDPLPEELVDAPFDFGVHAVAEVMASTDVLAHLANHAGARIPSVDTVDADVRSKILSGGDFALGDGPDVNGGYSTPAPGTPWLDVDLDGIPDEVELSMFGKDVTGVATTPSGYSYIEVWANSPDVLGSEYVAFDPMITTSTLDSTTAASTTPVADSSSSFTSGGSVANTSTLSLMTSSAPLGAAATDAPGSSSPNNVVFIAAIGAVLGSLLLSWCLFVYFLRRRRQRSSKPTTSETISAPSMKAQTATPAGSEYSSLASLVSQGDGSNAPTPTYTTAVPIVPRTRSRRTSRSGNGRQAARSVTTASEYSTMPTMEIPPFTESLVIAPPSQYTAVPEQYTSFNSVSNYATGELTAGDRGFTQTRGDGYGQFVGAPS